MEFNLAYLLQQAPALWHGLRMTLQVSAAAMALSTVLGLLAGVARQRRVPVLW